MPFPDELQARIDALTNQGSEVDAKRLKLEKRRGKSGYTQNVRDLEAAIAEEQSHDDEA